MTSVLSPEMINRSKLFQIDKKAVKKGFELKKQTTASQDKDPLRSNALWEHSNTGLKAPPILASEQSQKQFESFEAAKAFLPYMNNGITNSHIHPALLPELYVNSNLKQIWIAGSL